MPALPVVIGYLEAGIMRQFAVTYERAREIAQAKRRRAARYAKGGTLR